MTRTIGIIGIIFSVLVLTACTPQRLARSDSPGNTTMRGSDEAQRAEVRAAADKLRMIAIGQSTYFAQNGGRYAESLPLLISAELVSRDFPSGYNFTLLRRADQEYSSRATPVKADGYHLLVESDGKIRYELGKPATNKSVEFGDDGPFKKLP